jgi:hypothetical protein
VNALRRAARAPLLWLGLCLLHLGLAWSLAQPVEAAARASLQNHVWPWPDRLLAGLAELFQAHPSVAAALAVAATASALLGGVLALLVQGGVIQRLHSAGDRGSATPAPDVARACALHLPALAAIAAYGLLLRLALSFVVFMLAGASVVAELTLLVLMLTFATCSGDLAAARRVVRGDRGLHPREYLAACADVARTPRLWLASGALTLARWAVAAAIVLVAIHGLGAAWSVWAARALACVTVFLALWRTAVAVEAVAARDK